MGGITDQTPVRQKTESKSLGTRWNNNEIKTWNIRWGENHLSAMGGGRWYPQRWTPRPDKFTPTTDIVLTEPVLGSEEPDFEAGCAESRIRDGKQAGAESAEEWKLTSVDKMGKDTKTLNYQFSFQRYVGDIRVMGDSLNLTIEADGQIQGFSVNSEAVLSKLPTDAKPAVSAEQAKAKYLEEIELKLKYGYYGGYAMNGNEIMKPFIKLIYYPTHKRRLMAALRYRLMPERRMARYYA